MKTKMKKKKVTATWAVGDGLGLGLGLGGEMQPVMSVGRLVWRLVCVCLTKVAKILILYSPINFTILRVI